MNGPYARVRRCPVQPEPHIDPPPPNQLGCGHCADYITGGMRIAYCPDHRWLCGNCTERATT